MNRLGSRGVSPRLLQLRHSLCDVPYRNRERCNVISAAFTRGVIHDWDVDGGRVDSDRAAKRRTALRWLRLLLLLLLLRR